MKEKDLDKDTIVAYHSYIQQQIKSDLNGVGLGPSRVPCYLASFLAILGTIFGIVGVLVITLRFRHVYLVSWNDQFLGPAFIIIFLCMMSLATFLVVIAKRRSNRYRRELYFRPIGDYGVGVIHKSTLMHEQQLKSELKSGTTPHKKIMPRAEVYSNVSHQGKSRVDRYGQENRGYDRERDDHRRRPDDRRDDDRRRRHEDDDRRRRHEGDDRRRHEGDDRRRHEGDDRRRHEGDDRRRHEGDDRRRREGDDRRREGDDRRRPDDDEQRRRHEERRRYEEDRRRRADMKRREAEGEGEPPEEQRRGRGPPKFGAPASQQPTIVLDSEFGMRAGRPREDSESEL